MLLGTGLILTTTVGLGAVIGTGVNAMITGNKRTARAAFLVACLAVGGANGKLMLDTKTTSNVAASTLVLK